MKRGRPLEIAIIGMACRFPGARDLASFWENLVQARDCTSEVPADRWDPTTFFDPDSRSNDRVYCKRGGYLEAPIEFDPARHGVMPMAVAGGEPEQYLVLDAAREALVDAGIADGLPRTQHVEVVIGRGNYFNRGNLTRLQHGRVVAQTLELVRDLHPEWDETILEAIRADLKSSLPPFEPATIAGQITNATAGRVANRLDLTGASYVVDAASASSLVALDLGARALVERRADLALVGGVYLAVDVDFSMVFCQLGALSREGRARPFARDADGTLPGEGVGVVVLKRLADAERDHDRIYAVLQGVGLSSDGRNTGLATPSARGHARAIRRAYRRSGIDPATIGVVEGHGLGVPASDRAELRALNAVFPRDRWTRRNLGSVSAMIGHAMPAAGMAGLIKSALSLHNRVLLATPGDEAPHPLLGEDASPFEMNRITRPWIHGDRMHPRRAGVNAFGFAGVSAHAILEEHSPSADGMNPGPQTAWETETILLGAEDRQKWIARATRLIDWLGRNVSRPVVLKDLAFTLNQEGQAGERDRSAIRVGLVVKSPAELRERLEAVVTRIADPSCLSIRDARGTYFTDGPHVGSEGLAFLFPGEGSQYPGMLADLCPHFPEVRALFDTADRIARDRDYSSLPSQALFGAEREGQGLWSVGMATNLVLSAQWALHQLLIGLGLQPRAVLGHSSGEFLALAAAGSLNVDQQLEASLGELGRIFEQLEQSGQVPTARLVAVAADRVKVERIAEQVGPGSCIAIDNCPHQVVLAGQAEVVEVVVQRLREQGVMCEDLPFDRAYHTAAFTVTLGPIRKFFADMSLSPPRVHFYSCAIAGRVTGGVNQLREVAVDQWAQPVEFRSTIEAMYHDGIRSFVEVGARGNLTGFVADILRNRPHFAVAANLPRRSGLTQLNHLVASLFAQGVALRPDRLYERRRPSRIDLNLDVPERQAQPALAVGFPAMRLSSRLRSELQSLTRTGANPTARAVAPPGQIATCISSDLPGSDAEGPLQPGESPVSDHIAALNSGGAVPRPAPPLESSPVLGQDAAMLEHLRTMEAFLETQRQVMGAYGLGGHSEGPAVWSDFEASTATATVRGDHASLGPWVGTIESIVPGRELVAVRWIDVPGDPVAEHHTLGGRKISALDPSRKGLPVIPFTVMAEMLAEAASVLVPHSVVIALRDVQALKWIRYEAEPVALEIRAWRDDASPDDEVRVTITNRGTARTRNLGFEEKVVEGRVIFGEARAPGPEAAPFSLESARECHFRAEDVYKDQWLFHGPAMQAIVGLGGSSPQGIEGTLRVLPRQGLLRDSEPLALRTDPIVLDAFTQLLGCWGMDQLEEGHVIFPLRVEEIALFGEDPPEGTEVACRITIHELSRHLVKVGAEVVTEDGRVWMRIRGWEDWRFHWPKRCRDHFRQPDRWFIGEPLPLSFSSPELTGEPRAMQQAVWLAPPVDFGKPIWRDVLEWVQLGPEERLSVQQQGLAEPAATYGLWCRVAAKEAVQRLVYDRGEPSVYPADLVIEADPLGGEAQVVSFLTDPSRLDRPTIATAHADGVAVALATLDPEANPGIAIALIDDFINKEPVDLSVRELEILAQAQAQGGEVSRTEWTARLASARNVYRNHSRAASSPLVVTAADLVRGEVMVTRGSSWTSWEPPSIRVVTERKGDYVWAWTLGTSQEQG